jgi:excisionase family DNA binding protein
MFATCIESTQIEVTHIVPKEINHHLFYSATETCERIGISRATLQRWIQKGLLNKIRRDRRGFRLFTEEDLSTLKAKTETIIVEEIPFPIEED